MTDTIKYILNKKQKNTQSNKTLATFSPEMAKITRKFHSTFHQYEATPLTSLNSLAKHLNIQNIWVKNESYRFGLNAFKVLGASFAIANYISKKLKIPISELSFEKLTSTHISNKLSKLTFITATDGNHGRGVAWTAKQLGQKAIIFMPKGSSITRLNNIKKLGADAQILDLNYDDTVRYATKLAKENNWILIQDTAWDGYEEIPTWIMQGYLTIFDECFEQLKNENPTHIFIQAGVGSLAAALQAYIINRFGSSGPLISVVEPLEADCFYKSVLENKGLPEKVLGNHNTIMAGLACGEPSSIAWNILRDHSHSFFACSDSISEKGMRILGNPIYSDKSIVSGESGAVTLGLIYSLLKNNKYNNIVDELNINQKSKFLLISTEGDTDPNMYKTILEKSFNTI
jgi:diaminopropionate ammonia-lyase